MYKVLIVDDDPYTRYGLQANFNWDKFSFEVCGTAGDGATALNMILQQRPDLLLLDIEMPRMNGIELLEELERRKIRLKTIVLSGYDHFQYVRSALLLGATDYLLKPLHTETAEKLLNEIAEQIRNERLSSETNKNTQLILENFSEEMLRQTTLSYLSGLRSDTENVRFILRHFHFSAEQNITLALVHFLTPCSLEDCLHMLSASAASEASLPLIIPDQNNFILLFSTEFSAVLSFLNSLTSFFPEFQCLLAHPAEFEQLPSVFRIVSSKASWFYLPINQISHLSEICHTNTIEACPSLPSPAELLKSIHEQPKDYNFLLLESFFTHCRKAWINPDIVIIQIAQFCAQYSRHLSHLQPKLTPSDFNTLYLELQNCGNIAELESMTMQRLSELTELYLTLNAEKGDLMEQALAYLNLHYKEDFSLNKMADSLFVNPAYLSFTFSKNKGITITAYLRELRLNKAAHLLQTSSESINAIGKAVGYDNYQHFCRLFKAAYAVTPSEYRNRFRRTLWSEEKP